MAITTVIILTFVLITVSTSIALSSFTARLGALDETNKQQSRFAAQGCMDQALLNLSLNNVYLGNETLTIGIGNQATACTIDAITTAGNNKTIHAWSSVNGLRTNLAMVVQSATLQQVSYNEVASF